MTKFSKYDFSMQNKVSTDNLYSKQRDIGKNIQLSRGSGSRISDKSLEFGSKPSVLSADRNQKYENTSYKNLRTSNADSIKTMKMMQSISNKNSVNNLLRGGRVDGSGTHENSRHNMSNSRDDKVYQALSKPFATYLDNSENDSKAYDSPNKPNDGKSYSNKYKLPSNNTNSSRYRSISFQSKLESSGAESASKSNERNKFAKFLPERKSQHYRNLPPKEEEDINFEARVKARQAMRNREFERVYQESTENILKSPPIHEVSSKAPLRFQNTFENSRKSLADQMQKQKSHPLKFYHNIETLNTDRSGNRIYDMQVRSAVLVEKEIPDEGNAQRPDMHKTKINNFQGTGRKPKYPTKNQIFDNLPVRKLNMNTSYEAKKNLEFRDSDNLLYKHRLLESKENRHVKTKRNLNENIEPDRQDKFVHIKSSENFCPGRAREEQRNNSDSKWNFWQTLKNPLQWLGLGKEHTSNTPNKSHQAGEIPEMDYERNRSISYHVYDPKHGWITHTKPEATEKNLKFARSTEKYQNFAKAFKKAAYTESYDQLGVSKSLRYSRKDPLNDR